MLRVFLHFLSLTIMPPESERENPKELATRQERKGAFKAVSGYLKKKKKKGPQASESQGRCEQHQIEIKD